MFQFSRLVTVLRINRHMYSGGSRISQVGKGPLICYSLNFPQNRMKMKKMGGVGEHIPKSSNYVREATVK